MVDMPCGSCEVGFRELSHLKGIRFEGPHGLHGFFRPGGSDRSTARAHPCHSHERVRDRRPDKVMVHASADRRVYRLPPLRRYAAAVAFLSVSVPIGAAAGLASGAMERG